MCWWVVCCLNTPEMHVLDSNGESCGRIKNHFNCIDHNFAITDHTGAECLTVSGSGCQPAAFCFAPCSPCNEMIFEVVNNRTGTTGNIKRKWDSWARQLVCIALGVLPVMGMMYSSLMLIPLPSPSLKVVLCMNAFCCWVLPSCWIWCCSSRVRMETIAAAVCQVRELNCW